MRFKTIPATMLWCILLLGCHTASADEGRPASLKDYEKDIRQRLAVLNGEKAPIDPEKYFIGRDLEWMKQNLDVSNIEKKENVPSEFVLRRRWSSNSIQVIKVRSQICAERVLLRQWAGKAKMIVRGKLEDGLEIFYPVHLCLKDGKIYESLSLYAVSDRVRNFKRLRVKDKIGKALLDKKFTVTGGNPDRPGEYTLTWDFADYLISAVARDPKMETEISFADERRLTAAKARNLLLISLFVSKKKLD